MTMKRTTLKGKGKDLYFPTSTPARQHTSTETAEQKVEKATFYLPPEVTEQLEAGWFELRKEFKNKKVSKSAIVAEALKRFMRDLPDMPAEERARIF